MTIDLRSEYILHWYNMSTSDNYCEDGASKSNDDVCEMNSMFRQLSTADNKDSISVCANCGKEGSDVNNICSKCKQVKYCNAICKKVHKKKHKKDCEEHIRQAAELRDIELFKQPPPEEDCPICFLQMPSLDSGRRYMSCCGKTICSGCIHAPVYDNQGNKVAKRICPFCRTPSPTTDEEIIKRLQKRVEAEDLIAIGKLGSLYHDGRNGYPQDVDKALEFYHRAAELGCSEAYNNIGYLYEYGEGAEVDKKKAAHYFELAAMRGGVYARHNLGLVEGETGNMDRALKHYLIASRNGYADSLKCIKQLYLDGYATKEDYTTALQSYQAYLGEIKSKQRDDAAAADNRYRYY